MTQTNSEKWKVESVVVETSTFHFSLFHFSLYVLANIA